MRSFFVGLSILAFAAVTASAQTQAESRLATESNKRQQSETTTAPAQRVSYTYQRGSSGRHAVVRVGPSSTYLKEGLSTAEVVAFLGQPARISQQRENGEAVVVYEFSRSENQTLFVEFIGDRLVRTKTEPSSKVPQSESPDWTLDYKGGE